jgi:hypothetical protein
MWQNGSSVVCEFLFGKCHGKTSLKLNVSALAVSTFTVWFEENHGIKNNQKKKHASIFKSLVSPSIVVSSDA